MTVHVLDTGAVFLLLNKHKPPLLDTLTDAADKAEAIWIPAPVLVEIGQAKEPQKKRLAKILEFASVVPLVEHVAVSAAAALRSVERARCEKCSGFVRPTLVDAVVMAVAAEYANAERTIVYTQDHDDLTLLRSYFADVDLMGV